MVLLALCLGATAHAGTFQVGACSGAPGNANNSWKPFNNSPAYLQMDTSCARPGGPVVGGPSVYTSGLSASEVLHLSSLVPQAATAGWTFAAPPGTTISAAALSRDLYKRNDNSWLLFVSDQFGTQVPGQNCMIGALEYQCEVSGTLSLTGLSDTSLSVGAMCNSAGCVNGYSAHDVRVDLDSAVVTLSDATPPAPATASGPLIQPSWHSGPVALEVSSSDAVGISHVAVQRADGTVLGSASQICDYTKPVPCPQASAVPLQIDTTQLPDGVVPLTLVATDTAQNTTASTTDVMISNHGPAPPMLSGAPVGWTVRPSATITARLTSSGVPIETLDWRLCASSSCGATTAVSVPAGAASVTFTATAPRDGAYTIEAYAIDAAGRISPTASEPLDVGRSPRPPPAGGGGSGGVVTLPARPGVGVTLPAVVGRDGVRLLLTLRRRARGRLELDLRTSPQRAGRVLAGLAFDGRRGLRRRLDLRRGAAKVVVAIPSAATKLTLSLDAFGTSATRRLLLARASVHRHRARVARLP